MELTIPELSIVSFIGESSSVKLDFIKKYFHKSEVITIDELEVQGSTRLEKGELVGIELTQLDEESHIEIVRLGKKYHCMPVAIVFNPEVLLEQLNTKRKNKKEDKNKNENKRVGKKRSALPNIETYLLQKGYKKVYVLNDVDATQNAKVQRTKLINNKKDIHGPFDIIGDIHGCYDELCELLEKLDYIVDKSTGTAYSPESRIVAFVGDLVDRGPKIVEVLKLVMSMVKEGRAYCVRGNHDGKLERKLRGSNVQIIHGLEKTLEELKGETEIFKQELKDFLEGLPSHYVFDEGKLVVAHAGLKEKLQGRESPIIRDLAMFGETTGKVDEFGLPIRLNWSEHYKGSALVVYGHTPHLQAKIINNTINVDTGCVYGGKLTAYRYPEGEIVEVEAKEVYYESVRLLSN
nr:metallophosphoesterase [uncultured Niameybacter sp.]